ncbi:pyridoxamine 5'-phosphate oxidase [Achromobacter sp. RTa]|uniref:pyridoxamine 5'-phosphate oxidase family protein n=1 Tax=Achromobacter sp. RTa TaxID=1532557 RepID=UPI00050EEFAC|nr:pyridoxamine 5'-phosphate oxidase family protein [Achromobacter sp. RTa]KGD90788.1 pyridoxamine 5'-phosphate oxidase [Achromobacter sp. RTa]
MHLDPAHLISDADALQALYGEPGEASIKKEVDHVHPHYRSFIEAAPFAILATGGPDGLDASPRGDPAGFVVVENEKTLLLPDRRGNNRIDSLRNVLADPRVALLFLVPGVSETLRVNGTARISVEPALLARFEMDGKQPRSVLVIDVQTVYFQCSRALLRSKLWDPATQVPRSALPSVGRILSDLTAGTFDGVAYDRDLPARVAGSLY